jgi:hypothetical protein
MWKAAGSDPMKRPYEWSRLPSAMEFIEFVAKSLNTGLSGIMVSLRGRGAVL